MGDPRRRVTKLVLLAVLGLGRGLALPAETTPPAPTAFFNDYARIVSAGDSTRLNEKLKRFADETSTQILVAVFDKLPEDEALEDFTHRTAQAWRVGQKKLDNGAVLFVFVKDRKLRIEVGYGLEGALTDALSSRIIREAIVPAFRSGDWTGGIEAGVDAMMAATRGEYTAAPRSAGGLSGILPLLIFLIILIVFISLASRGGGGGRSASPYGRNYSRRGSFPWVVLGPGSGGGGWSGGGWGGGGGGGGGGGFSGGGGSFGGGGASGSW